MSTQRTGTLDVAPHLNGLLGVREDGTVIRVGGIDYTLPTSAATLARTDASQTFTGNVLTATNLGTVTTAATTVAEEHGDGLWHLTKLTMTAFSLGTSGDNAALGIGNKFYTFPAGAILVYSATINGGLTAAVSVTAQTPEVGIGTVIASGAISTLSTTFEDIVDGGAAGLIGGDNTAPDLAGGLFYKGMVSASSQGVIIKASGGKARDLFLNAAATWSDVTAAATVTFTGTITLEWRIV